MREIIRPVFSIDGLGFRTQFTEARLMSPKEVAASIRTEGTTFPTQFEGHWFICGDCSSAFYERVLTASAQEVMVEYRLQQTPDGAEFLLITHQVDSLQHRFLLPLLATRTPEFVKAIDRGVAGFSFGNNGAGEAALLGDTAIKNFAERVLAGYETPTTEQVSALSEGLPEALRVFFEPSLVQSMVEGCSVVEVSLSVLVEGIAPAEIPSARSHLQ